MRFQFSIPIRYVETDAMGFVHHGSYATYLEVARIEFLNSIGHPYHELENQNILLPVLSMGFQFLSPSKFGETLVVSFEVRKLGYTKIEFNYQIHSGERLVATAGTTHAFMNKLGKPLRPPEYLIEAVIK